LFFWGGFFPVFFLGALSLGFVLGVPVFLLFVLFLGFLGFLPLLSFLLSFLVKTPARVGLVISL
jgi:hypothetical protein